MKAWFSMQAAAADPSVVEILIFSWIGDWIDDERRRRSSDDDQAQAHEGPVTARSFLEQLARLSDQVKTIRVRVNSPGGDPFAGVAIANALREQRLKMGRQIDVVIDGLAASAASLPIMAGNRIQIADNALIMVHNPAMFCFGAANELRKSADDLDTIRGAMMATYRWHSPLSNEKLGELLDAETWMDADNAIANGFATEKVEGLEVAARFSPKALARLSVPAQYRNRVQAFSRPAPAPRAAAAAEDVLRLCREGGCANVAESLIVAKATSEEVTARVATEQQARSAEKTRVEHITVACKLAKLSTLAKGYIDARVPADVVKQHVTTIAALIDAGIGEVDGSLHPDFEARRRSVPGHQLDPQAIYDARKPKRTEERPEP